MSFLGLGYGLGGFTQGFQNAQQNAARNALLDAYLKQQQNQMAAQRLEGLALMAGGIPGLDPQALGGGSAFSGAAIPQSPMPGTSSQPAAASAPPATAPITPVSSAPLAPPPAAPASGAAPPAAAAPPAKVPNFDDYLPSADSPDLQPAQKPDPDLLEPGPAAQPSASAYNPAADVSRDAAAEPPMRTEPAPVAPGAEGRVESGDITSAGGGGYVPGNIDIHHRPVVHNPDGTISTVRSMSFREDGKEVLIPTVSDDGRILSSKEAIDEYHRTGKFLGKFNTTDEANAYAQRLHEQQAQEYGDRGGGGRRPDPAPQVPTSESGHVIISDPKSPGAGGIDLGTLINHASPVQIAQRIRAIAPDADPAAVAIATQNIYKLASQGDKLQQMMIAKVLGLQVQMRGQDLTHSDRQTTAELGKARIELGEKRENRVQGRFDQREARLKAAELDREAYRRQQMALQQEREARLAGRDAEAAAARKRSQDIQRIRAQIYSIVGGKGVAGVDEEGQKKLVELEKELQRLSGAK